MTEMVELVDYEDSKKDDQGWSEGSREDKSSELWEGHDESEVNDEAVRVTDEEVPVTGDPSGPVGETMLELQILAASDESMAVPIDDAPTTSPVERVGIEVHEEQVLGVAQEEDFIREEITVDMDPPQEMIANEEPPRMTQYLQEVCVHVFLFFHLLTC